MTVTFTVEQLATAVYVQLCKVRLLRQQLQQRIFSGPAGEVHHIQVPQLPGLAAHHCIEEILHSHAAAPVVRQAQQRHAGPGCRPASGHRRHAYGVWKGVPRSAREGLSVLMYPEGGMLHWGDTSDHLSGTSQHTACTAAGHHNHKHEEHLGSQSIVGDLLGLVTMPKSGRTKLLSRSPLSSSLVR